MDLEWSREDKIRIVERYWSKGSARCPRDDSVLKTFKSKTMGTPQEEISFRCPRCGRSFWSQEVDSAQDPNSFEGQYEEVSVLGHGGMGEITLVRNRSTGDSWAAKKLLPRLLKSEAAIKRFKREARILANLKHENIVPIKEVFLDEKGGVIVMPYVNGGTLKKRINDTAESYSALLSYFQDVAQGLKYLHSEGVIHRDLKPDNILIDSADGGAARISDFGLARLVDRDSTTLTVGAGLLGTPIYAAPEQRENAAKVDSRCDLYALALIAYEIVRRRSPYRTPINLTDFPTDLRSELSLYLEEEPERRPPDAQGLLQALERHADSS
jgi:serine/threonine protein kinase